MKHKYQSKRILDLMNNAVVYPNLRATPEGDYACIGLGKFRFLDTEEAIKQPFSKVVVVLLEKGKMPSMVFLDEEVFHLVPFYKSVKVIIKRHSNYSVLTMQRGKPTNIGVQVVHLASGEPVGWRDELVFRIKVNSHQLLLRDGKKD